MNNNERFIYLNGNIVNVNDAKINVLAPTAQFGLNVFEGIRCYWNEDSKQLYAFRLMDHFLRLKKSIKLLQLDDVYSLEDLYKAFKDTVKANNYHEDIAVRQTIFVDGFSSWSADGPVGMFVSPIPKKCTNAEYNKKGLHCCISSWRRINENVLSPRIKCGANYINSRMAQREALRNGYDTAIFINENGKVAEGPGSCLFIVKNNVLITPSLTESVLESITRDTLIKLAREMGYIVEERAVDRTELYVADEAFLCGSAMEITPIYSIDRFEISNGQVGRITEKLHNEYLKCVRGKSILHKEWIEPIY